MNVQELIDELKSQKIVVYNHGYRLLWEAPIDIEPSDEIKQAIKEHWYEIIKRVGGYIPSWVPKRKVSGQLVQGDCTEVMDMLPSNLVDLIVTDPPYGLEFMGKGWDKVIPSIEIWKECLRVLKPGGFAFIMSSPRQDVLSRMLANLQEAGFKTGFTSLYWTFARGFPKAKNISKAVDNKAGAKREVLDEHPLTKAGFFDKVDDKGRRFHQSENQGYRIYEYNGITEPATPEAKALDGSYAGYQPKPAVEVILIVQKPLSEKTYVDQALSNGKGITWLDDCKIPHQNEDARFPANLLDSDNVLDKACTHKGGFSKFFSLDAWGDRNMDGLHIEALEEFDQKVLPYLIVPKPSKREKEFGCENLLAQQVDKTRNNPDAIGCNNPRNRGGKQRKNHHPTVKPILLMSYLIKLGSREGDLVLDPFCGTGTTCMAARLLKRPSIGIEKDPKYADIAAARIRALVLATWGEKSESEEETAEK